MLARRTLGIFVALLLVLAAPLQAADEKAKPKEPAKAEKPKLKLTFGTLTLNADYAEGPGQAGIFGEMTPNLNKIIERIDAAAADDKLTGLVLHLDGLEIGRGKVGELRAAIARARKAGKRVYADLHEGSAGAYLLASACDEIIMPPVGMVTIAGVRMEIMYYKKLFDMIGVKADMLQVGDFKGAAEPYTRTNMSPEFRKQTETVVEDYYKQMISTIAADRKIDPAKVKALIDEGLFTAQAAKEAKLIDQVTYCDEFEKQLKDAHKADEIAIVEDYGKKKIDEDFSGFAGLVKMFELMAGVEPRGKASSSKKIAVIYAVGPISTGESSSSLFGEDSVGSDTIVAALKQAAEDSKVAAIVLRIDSPGGSALASDMMWREIARIKGQKPVVASMGDIAASGGYYISMGCTKIFAEEGTLTGSIGVISGKFSLKGLYDKIGLSTDVLARGKNSGWMSSDQPFTTSEREVMLRMMKDVYGQFTQKAAQGRNLELKQLESLAGGKLYTGRMAKEQKLVDEVGTLEDAVADAKRLAGLPDNEKVERLILPRPKPLFEELFGSGAATKATVKVDLGTALPELAVPLKAAQSLRRLFAEPAVLALPYYIRVR
ncbi:MAG: signal peptide peptidase SppA [Pirellulales bacterium]|nr:signal peptide peptidase SppA [Pirellulales bacterium]